MRKILSKGFILINTIIALTISLMMFNLFIIGIKKIKLNNAKNSFFQTILDKAKNSNQSYKNTILSMMHKKDIFFILPNEKIYCTINDKVSSIKLDQSAKFKVNNQNSFGQNININDVKKNFCFVVFKSGEVIYLSEDWSNSLEINEILKSIFEIIKNRSNG